MGRLNKKEMKGNVSFNKRNMSGEALPLDLLGFDSTLWMDAMLVVQESS